jgi:outer membrane cobalamin receptor
MSMKQSAVSISKPARCCGILFIIITCMALMQPMWGTAEAPTTNSALYKLPLSELMEIRISSASLFDSDELTIGSTVGAFQPEEWRRLGVRRTLDTIRYEPGTMVLPSAYGFDVIAIRGYAQVASSRGIATVLDGVPLNGVRLGSGQYSAQNIGLGILDQVELIRGPGSAIYGTDAFHGVLALSAFESDEDLTSMSLEGGMNDYYQASVRHSVGIGSRARINLALATSGENRNRVYRAADLYTQALGDVNPDEHYRSQTGSLKLLLDPTPTLRLTCGLYLDDFGTYAYPGVPEQVGDSRWDSTTEVGRLAVEQSLARGRTLELSAYHVKTEAPRSLVTVFGSMGVIASEAETREDRMGAALTFRQSATGDRNTQYAVAVGYDDATFKDGSLTLMSLDDPTASVPLHYADEGMSRYVCYLLLDARTVLPWDRLSVSYGVRLDRYSDFGSQTTPRLGLVFQPVDDTAIKFLYNHAFRAPTTAERRQLTGVELDLDPETLDSYELVFQKRHDTLRTELVLFENRWNDGIVLRSMSTAPGYTYANAGESEARGVEASVSWLPRPWRFDLAAAYVRSRNVAAGHDYDLFPRAKVTIGVGRQLDDRGTEVIINNHFFDEAKDIADGSALAEPADLRTYWRTDVAFFKPVSDGLDIFANVINLFDRDNRYPSVMGFPGGVPDRPFSVSAGIRYRM